LKRTKPIPKTAFGRASKLVGLGLNLVAREAASKVLEKIGKLEPDTLLGRRIKQTSELVETLSQLKGAAMKAGQILSLEFSDLLPPELTEVLRSLHDQSTFMEFDEVTKILTRELSPELFNEISDISKIPLAAASIGQVHLARFRSRDIVLKIQFPGVSKSIDSDLKIIQKVLKYTLKFQNRPDIEIDSLLKELRRALKQETDYKREAKSLQDFSRLVADTPNYRVPDIYPEISTKKVLAMSYEEGLKLKTWISTERSNAQNEVFASTVLKLLFKELFEWGFVQTDPNYGNFLYRPDQSQLVLLDFGAANRYSIKVRKQIFGLLSAALERNEQSLLDRAYSANILDCREGAIVQKKFVDMMEIIVKIFRKEHQPFDFSNSEYLKTIRDSTLDFASSVKYTAPAKQLIFLNRKLGGMFHLLKDMRITHDLNQYWLQLEDLEL
jgi:aarF domain-containing kinase